MRICINNQYIRLVTITFATLHQQPDNKTKKLNGSRFSNKTKITITASLLLIKLFLLNVCFFYSYLECHNYDIKKMQMRYKIMITVSLNH